MMPLIKFVACDGLRSDGLYFASGELPVMLARPGEPSVKVTTELREDGCHIVARATFLNEEAPANK